VTVVDNSLRIHPQVRRGGGRGDVSRTDPAHFKKDHDTTGKVLVHHLARRC
jgi:hypothetical protein